MDVAYELARIAIEDANGMSMDMLADGMLEAVANLTDAPTMANVARNMLHLELQEQLFVNEQTANEICDQLAAEMLKQCVDRAMQNVAKIAAAFNK